MTVDEITKDAGIADVSFSRDISGKIDMLFEGIGD